ncbi:MAG: YraN family protein [Armatimonadetes bacterium]|nr:MAG: YraN family protein [Armatimonadota bacterium]
MPDPSDRICSSSGVPTAMPHPRRIGDEAEDRAARYLAEIGYVLVKRNYVGRDSEIDLIALDGDCLVFVEVRYRKSRDWESPEESVSPAKQRRLWRAAEQYLADVVGKEMSMRFDVIALTETDLRHHKDAFRPLP